MIITGFLFAILTILAGLVTLLIGLIGWVILKLMKEELHLNIKIEANNKTK